MRRLSLVIGLVVGLQAVEGHTGTYGSQTKDFQGYQIDVDCSVGAWEDSQEEIAAFNEAKAAAVGKIEQASPGLATAFEHFATGKHPFTLTRGLLAAKSPKAPGESTRLARAGWAGNLRVNIYLKKADDDLGEKVAADFALSQLTNMAMPKPGSCIFPADKGEGWLWDVDAEATALMQAEACRERIAAFVATGGDPAKPGPLANGKILLGIFAGDPPPPDVLAPLKGSTLERIGLFYANTIPAAKAARLLELRSWTKKHLPDGASDRLKQHAETLATLAK